mgnify:CR=1 FL=1
MSAIGKAMNRETEQKDSARVDKGLVTMFLRMSPDERLLANDNMVRTILELRKASKDPEDKQRLMVLEETLRQMNEDDGTHLDSKRNGTENDGVD